MTALRRAVLAITVTTAAVACNGGTPEAQPTTTASTSTTAAPTTSTAPTSLAPGSPEDKAAVLKVIDRYWEEIRSALDPPDPERPALMALLDGDARIRTHLHIRQFRDNGQYARRRSPGPNPHRSSSPEITDDKAVVYECRLDDAIVYKSDGSVLNDEVGQEKYRTLLVRKGGSWLIAGYSEPDDGKADALCAGLA